MEMEPVSPPASLTVSVTVYRPAVAQVFLFSGPRLSPLPLPQVHAQPTTPTSSLLLVELTCTEQLGDRMSAVPLTERDDAADQLSAVMQM